MLQMKCQVCQGDTPETFKGKVQKLEGVSYVRAIRKFAERGDKVTYKDAGVDIVAGSDLVDMINPGCDTDLGGFGSLFDLSAAGYAGDDVVIVGATDARRNAARGREGSGLSSSSRAPSLSSSSTTTPRESSTSRRPPMSCAASPTGAGRLTAASSAGKPPRCRACTPLRRPATWEALQSEP